MLHTCASLFPLQFAVLACATVPMPAQSKADAVRVAPALIERVHAAIDGDAGRLDALFKDLHAHPEIGFTETRTAGIVAAELKRLGFGVTTGIARTGVVGVLRNGAGPTVWYRADMDANQVRETTGLPYAAQEKQRLSDGTEIDVMHACGHDAHVTWMLGAAQALVALKGEWSGTLVVYAQPAEELGMGAQAMVKDGLWERGFPRPDRAFGMHAAPGPVGLVACAPGVRMAGTDQLDITFLGVGGHGSTPEMTIDPVVLSAQAVLAYQTIVSRTLDPQASAVVTVGAIEAGTDHNVIPERALLKLNLRWFTSDVRERILERIDAINLGLARAAGVPDDRLPTRTMRGHAGPLVNDAALAESVTPDLTSLLGQGKVVPEMPAVMGSEDFQEAFAPLGTPYLFLLVGVAPPAMYAEALAAGRPQPYSNHNPNFFVELAAIPLGTKVGAVAVLSLLATGGR